MSNFKKSLKVILASMLALSMLAACGETSGSTETSGTTANTAADTTAAPDGGDTAEDTTAADVVERDLGGKTITIGNWWANSDDMEVKTTYQEDLVAYRNWIQETYNCTIKEVNLCEWGKMQETAGVSIMAGTPEADIFVLDSSFVAALLKQGLFYPVSELPSVNFDDAKWNQYVKEVMTFKGKTYGFATDYEARNGIFFNKRLLEEAGIDPEEPYNLQASGGWTWEAFEEMCKKTTRDIDNDSIIDTYAIASFHVEFMNGAVYSNNAKYVGKDADGNFYNASNEPQFLEACQFVHRLAQEGYVMPSTEDNGGQWDWFKAAFHDGQAAFRVDEEYAKGQLADMKDDWGFVLFPAGPSGSLTPIYRENVLVVPSTFSEQEADDIMFAYSLWTDPVPGYEDEETWRISAYPNYRDERAVDETLSIMRSGENGVLEFHAYVAGFKSGDIAYNIWNLDRTPAELIESVQNSWDVIISDMNALFNNF